MPWTIATPQIPSGIRPAAAPTPLPPGWVMTEWGPKPASGAPLPAGWVMTEWGPMPTAAAVLPTGWAMSEKGPVKQLEPGAVAMLTGPMITPGVPMQLVTPAPVYPALREVVAPAPGLPFPVVTALPAILKPKPAVMPITLPGAPPLPEGAPPSDIPLMVTKEAPSIPVPPGVSAAIIDQLWSALGTGAIVTKTHDGYQYRALTSEAAATILPTLNYFKVGQSLVDAAGNEWMFATPDPSLIGADPKVAAPGSASEWIILALASGYGVVVSLDATVGTQPGIALLPVTDVSVASELTKGKSTIVYADPPGGWQVPGKPVTEPDPEQQKLAEEVIDKAAPETKATIGKPALSTAAIIGLAALGVVVVGGVAYVVTRKKG